MESQRVKSIENIQLSLNFITVTQAIFWHYFLQNVHTLIDDFYVQIKHHSEYEFQTHWLNDH